jgi:hypothetical protein
MIVRAAVSDLPPHQAMMVKISMRRSTDQEFS